MAAAFAPPLAGIKAVSLASLGPGPYAAMLLADLGCDVVIVDRTVPMASTVAPDKDPRRRGQRSIALDLKNAEARKILDELIAAADVLMEGMRPGAAEKLGLAPSRCLAHNPRLIYARVTGWGQDGPLAATAGHDINYVAISGALHAMGDADRPPPVPLNLLGDYAGGGMFVALGILAALLERVQSGQGQVIDGAIIDGVGSLTAATLGMLATNRWSGRGENVLDGGAPWYRSYRTRDGGYVAVGAIEPPFFAALLAGVGLDPAIWRQGDAASWPALTAELARTFASHDRQYWEERFAGTDACVSPVLSFRETLDHPHHRARGTYTHVGGIAQPAPGPRMSRSKAALPTEPPALGADTDSILSSLGRSRVDIARLRAAGVIR